MASPKITLFLDTVSPFAYEAYHILRVSASQTASHTPRGRPYAVGLAANVSCIPERPSIQIMRDHLHSHLSRGADESGKLSPAELHDAKLETLTPWRKCNNTAPIMIKSKSVPRGQTSSRATEVVVDEESPRLKPSQTRTNGSTRSDSGGPRPSPCRSATRCRLTSHH